MNECPKCNSELPEEYNFGDVECPTCHAILKTDCELDGSEESYGWTWWVIGVKASTEPKLKNEKE